MKTFKQWNEEMGGNWQDHLRAAIDSLGQAAATASTAQPEVGQQLDMVLKQLYELSQKVNPVDTSNLQPGDRRY